MQKLLSCPSGIAGRQLSSSADACGAMGTGAKQGGVPACAGEHKARTGERRRAQARHSGGGGHRRSGGAVRCGGNAGGMRGHGHAWQCARVCVRGASA
eukprot:5012743-Pleurochrysis_carterae.AAC.1